MNYYTQFCYELPLPSGKAVHYALNLHAKAMFPDADKEAFPEEIREHLENWTFEVEKDETFNTNSITILSTEGGLDAAMAFTQHLLAKYAMPDEIQITWASYGDNPSPDTGHGGAAIITAAAIETYGACEWLNDAPKRKAAEIERAAFITTLQTIYANAAESPEWIRERIAAVLTDSETLNAADAAAKS